MVGEQAGEQRSLYFKVIRRKKVKTVPSTIDIHAIACPGNTEKVRSVARTIESIHYKMPQ